MKTSLKRYYSIERKERKGDYMRRFIIGTKSLLIFAHGNSCYICGAYFINLQMAHLEPTGLYGLGRGEFYRIEDWINHFDSYAPMCKSCHKRFDKMEFYRNFWFYANKLSVDIYEK